MNSYSNRGKGFLVRPSPTHMPPPLVIINKFIHPKDLGMLINGASANYISQLELRIGDGAMFIMLTLFSIYVC